MKRVLLASSVQVFLLMLTCGFVTATFGAKSGRRLMEEGDSNDDMLPLESIASTLLNALDLLCTAVFAFSAALMAGKKGMDLLGMMVVSTVTSTAGGTIRDVILGFTPVFWIQRPIYLLICLVVTIATYVLWPKLESRYGWKDSAKIVCIADALGLGAFAVLGTQKAAQVSGLDPCVWIVSGLMSATFGGIARDVLCQEPPRALYSQRTMYAIHPLLGSAVYAGLISKLHVQKDKAAIMSFVLISSTRILSFKSPLRLPHWKSESEKAHATHKHENLT